MRHLSGGTDQQQLDTRPGPANSSELRDLARQAAQEATLVGVDVGFAADRAWKKALPEIKADAPTTTLLDSLATFDGVPPVTAFVEQLAAVRGILSSPEPWHGNEARLEVVGRIKLWRHLTGDARFDVDYWLTRLENQAS